MSKFRLVAQSPLDGLEGDGFRILADHEVAFDSKGDSTLAMPLRRIEIERQDAPPISVLTNDMTRPPVEIAALYKARWQIELLFRWIKQHLEPSRFLANNHNAIQLQIIAAMIAYLLLRLAADAHALKLPALRLAELVRSHLFVRKPMANLHNPPPVKPSKPQPPSPNQPSFCYV
jgi:putative transposase